MKPTFKEIEKAKRILLAAGYIDPTCWHIGDIIDRAADLGFKITETQAFEIAALISRRFDAQYGINWDHIDACIQEYFEDDKK